MRYEFRENHDGKDLFDEHEGYYMNEEECLEKLNEQDAEIELLKKLRKQDKQYEDNLLEVLNDHDRQLSCNSCKTVGTACRSCIKASFEFLQIENQRQAEILRNNNCAITDFSSVVDVRNKEIKELKAEIKLLKKLRKREQEERR